MSPTHLNHWLDAGRPLLPQRHSLREMESKPTFEICPDLPSRSLISEPSSSSISDMKGNESPKLRVLIASCGSRDVAQANALIMRLSKNTKVEIRSVFDEYPFSDLMTDDSPSLIKERYTVPGEAFNKKTFDRDRFNSYGRQAYDLCAWADMLVLAPIDADTFAKMLHGITDCVVLEVLRGWDTSKKILLVPGMSIAMWENPMTKKQLNKVRRKWQWVRVMQPLLWFYEEDNPKKCLLGWDGLNELVDAIKNQAELMTIGHDVDIAATGAANLARQNVKTDALLPPEVWTLVFEYVGDWEVARALNVYTKLPTPNEWQRRLHEQKNDLDLYMRSLEWTMLTSPIPAIIEKLETAPKDMKYLSSLCVKLVIKFCLIDILTYLEGNFKDLFWSSFGQKLLPTKASAVYGRTEILEWWRTSPTFLSKDYTTEAIDGASKSGFVHVLDWWRKSSLPLKYTASALEQASSKGHILVLEWWKQASLHQGSYHVDAETRHRHGLPAVEEGSSTPSETQPALKLKPGKSLITAAQNNQSLVLRWWDNSGIQIQHADSVAKVASQHGYVNVLDAWLELKGDKMAFDNQVLVQPTKNGHVEVLEWWKKFSEGDEGRPGGKVEYKTCDIEEALEDSVGSQAQEMEVKRWWAKNGLNLGVIVSEWTKVKVL